jgi:short-subunit dehydrogenase
MSFHAPIAPPRRIAIVGGRIYGMAAALLLAQGNRVSLFEAAPRLGDHGASKAGLMRMAENRCADLRGTVVTVQMVNPSLIYTRLKRKNSFRMPQLMRADEVAGRVMRAIGSGRFSTSFTTPFAWLFALGRHVPLALFLRIFR